MWFLNAHTPCTVTTISNLTPLTACNLTEVELLTTILSHNFATWDSSNASFLLPLDRWESEDLFYCSIFLGNRTVSRLWSSLISILSDFLFCMWQVHGKIVWIPEIDWSGDNLSPLRHCFVYKAGPRKDRLDTMDWLVWWHPFSLPSLFICSTFLEYFPYVFVRMRYRYWMHWFLFTI